MEEEEGSVNRRKNKYTESVEKRLFIFTNAGDYYWPAIRHPEGTMCAGVFEIDIVISTRVGEKPVAHLLEKEEEIIEPIATFYKQRFSSSEDSKKMISSVASCLIGTDLYMIPDKMDEEDEEPTTDHQDRGNIVPLKFNLINNNKGEGAACDKPKIPNIPKAAIHINPVVAVVRDHVYSLSFFYSPPNMSPCFQFANNNNPKEEEESTCKCWIKLNFPDLPVPTHMFYQYSGHAVLDDCFLVVSFLGIRAGSHHQDYFVYSYNVQTGNWKTVAPRDGDKEPYALVLWGESVVIEKDIYTYIDTDPSLIVASYIDVSKQAGFEENDILLGNYRVVQGLDFHEEFPKRLLLINRFDDSRIIETIPSGVVAKVDDDDKILCVLNTVYLDADQILHVCGSVIQLDEERPDLCTTLKTFTCLLKAGTQLSYPTIKASYVMNSNGTSDHRPRKRAALEDEEQMDLA